MIVHSDVDMRHIYSFVCGIWHTAYSAYSIRHTAHTAYGIWHTAYGLRHTALPLLLRLADWWHSSVTSVSPPATTRWFMIVHSDVRSTATLLLRNSAPRWMITIHGIVGGTAPPPSYASLIDDSTPCCNCRWQSTPPYVVPALATLHSLLIRVHSLVTCGR
jgi:hypothetical protein